MGNGTYRQVEGLSTRYYDVMGRAGEAKEGLIVMTPLYGSQDNRIVAHHSMTHARSSITVQDRLQHHAAAVELGTLSRHDAQL